MQHNEFTPLARHRLSLRPPYGYRWVTQKLIAAWAGRPKSQGVVAKLESGHLPPDLDEQRVWARAYRLTLKKFVEKVQASRGWSLPLWEFAAVAEQPGEVIEIGTENVHAPAGTAVRRA